jgi:hypothetical protein
MRKKLLLALLLSVSMPAVSDVFGLKGGMQLHEIEKKVHFIKNPELEGYYMATELPKGSKNYKMYVFSVDKKCGLFTINAVGNDIPPYEDNSNANELAGKLKEVTDEIISDYGTPENYGWEGDKDSPYKASYIALWGGKDSKKLPNDVGMIAVKMSFDNNKIPSISTTYIFRSAGLCKKK